MPRIGAERWTAEMVRAFPNDGNRYEVIDGVLLVTPSPRPVHQRAVTELLFALRLWIGEQDIGEVLTSPADLELEPDDLVQPDIFVSRIGVPEYWIVDCDQRVVERWRPGAATPEFVSTTLAWHPEGATSPFVLDLVAYFKAVHTIR